MTTWEEILSRPGATQMTGLTEERVMRKHPPGLVAVIAQETGRYSAFAASLGSLVKPPGTEVEVSIGSERAPQRNQLVELMFERGLEWIWFIDDDHVFGPDCLERLLDHNVEVVQALTLLRRKPFPPAAFEALNEEETHGDYLDLGSQTSWLPRVASAGSAGMLIRREVFAAIEQPWFYQDDFRSEDMRFCQRLREAEIPIHVDLTTVTGHLTTCAIWPIFDNGAWKVGFQVGGSYQIKVPIEGRKKLVLAR